MTATGLLISRLDYRRLAASRGALEGRIALRELPRLCAETAGTHDSEPIAVELFFFEDTQRRARFEGRIEAALDLRCQRCLRIFRYNIAPLVAGVVVGDDAAAADIPRADEPVLADDDGMLDVHALVVDELLLALPAVARCDTRDCRARYERPVRSDGVAGMEKDDKPNPFAVLKDIGRDR